MTREWSSSHSGLQLTPQTPGGFFIGLSLSFLTLQPMPRAPVYPPTADDVLDAVEYNQNVDLSIGMQITFGHLFLTSSLLLTAERPVTVQCTRNDRSDRYGAIMYESALVSRY